LTTARDTSAAGPPALTGLDRRTSQKLTRGLVAYEAKLDLHGTTAEQARGQLQRFLLEARARGNRLVLVVTGKGASPYARHTLHGDSHYHVPERQGRLRRLVAEWFHESEFRHLVSGFQPAHPRHGGGGAFYVRLRRRREGP
jgi:DNA-nicking Smr family endonuclease